MPTLKETLATRLGIGADVDDETVVAALDEALAEQATDANEAAAIAARAGVVTVDREQFAAMQDELAASREFRTRQETAEVTSYLNQAMAAGKFPPSKLSHYETLMVEAPKAARALIDELPANAFPVSEVGTTATPSTRTTIPSR
ncbi:hypothetical protein GS876_20980 [Rhodococcus hoagii]|nr:hypothetical protein [Prescottella equi]